MKLSNHLAAAAALSLSLMGCSKDEGSETSKAAQPTEEPAAAPSPTPAPTPAEVEEPAAATSDVLTPYERLRVTLVKDDTGPVPEAAAQLASAAEAAGHQALAGAATELSKAPTDDIEAVRLAFGEVSKHLVALLEKNPEMARGLHVFECPMAEGYKRWVQPGTETENPYMGQKMLACGGEVSMN